MFEKDRYALITGRDSCMLATSPISAVGSVSFGWLHEQGGFTFDEAYYLDPDTHLEREEQIHAFVASRFPNDPVYNMEAHLGRIEHRQQPIAMVGALQPNLLLGAAVGAQFVFYGDKDPDITPAPLAHIRDLAQLPIVDWEHQWPMRLLLDQTRMMLTKWHGQRAVVPPFFWDTGGRATIHGVLTTAQKLLGERIFIELIDNPSFVRGLLQWISDSYAQLIELFANAADMKVTGIHVGECSLCTISASVFRETVLSNVDALSHRFGSVRLHSCGQSNHLLDAFQEVQRLGSLNVGSNTSLVRMRERFPTLPIDLIPDTQLLTDGTPRDIDAWVRQCIHDNGSAPLQFQYHLERSDAESNCLQIHRTLQSLGITSQRLPIR